MDPKQAQLKELFIEYFRQRVDTDVYPDAGGTYRVILKSEVAQTDFGGREQLSLIFDADQAYENPESELITTSHPFLEIIRNDLERDPQSDPRLGEAHLLVQLLNPEGRLTVPQLIFSNGVQRVDYQLSYRMTFVLTYRIVYEADERSENIVRLCYDAVSGVPQLELVPKLRGIFPAEGVPPDVRVPDNLDLAPVLEAGRKEIEARITTDVRSMGRDVSTLLENEKKRLREYYETEIARIPARDHVTREQLRTTLEKDITELERKLACRVRVQLLSILRLWWPVVGYKLTVSGCRGDFVINDICYNSQTGQTTFFRCEVCDNETRYDICVVGEHVLCGGQCSKGLFQCSTCQDVFCSDHGGPCTSCLKPVCYHDRQRCSYGKHANNDYYCLNCLVESFEGRPLCKDCLEYCDLCRRPFPHEKMATCRIGGERVCREHKRSPDAFVCQDCGQVTCKVHGVRTADRKWACQDHVLTTTCCGKVYAKSRLVTCCVDSREVLCPDHRVTCLSCGRPVCHPHGSALHNHPGQFVCADCRRTCELCMPERSYLATDVAICKTCGMPVCADHRQVCAICGDVVCQKDLRISAEGEPLCPNDAQVATCCERTFAKSKLLPCSDNSEEALCPDHRVICLGCGQAVCQMHRSVLHRHPNQFTCGTCRRKCELCAPERSYLAADLALCKICGKPMCDDHRQVCVVGGEVVCQNDLHISVNNEPLCPAHAGHCAQCGTDPGRPVYRTDHLRTCIVCRSSVCQTHSSACPICQAYYICQAHRQTQPSCASCGRVSCGARGCRADSHTCSACGMTYCRHCIGRSGRCTTCEGLRETSIGEAWLKFLHSVRSVADATTAKVLGSVLESPTQLSLHSATNHTYQVVVLHYTPQWYQIWKSSQQIRIVVARTGQIKRVKIERFGS